VESVDVLEYERHQNHDENQDHGIGSCLRSS
jgi:hypothetical protein